MKKLTIPTPDRSKTAAENAAEVQRVRAHNREVDRQNKITLLAQPKPKLSKALRAAKRADTKALARAKRLAKIEARLAKRK